MLFKDLEQFGLKEKEAKVYLASLELGVSSVQKIAKKASINRATAYFVLDTLIEQGLVTHFQQGKKRYFAATHPAQLLRLIKQQKLDLEEAEAKLEKEVIPELLSIHNVAADKPKVMFYEGINGLRAMREDFLKTKDKEIEAIFPVEGYKSIFSERETKKYREARKKKNIHVRAIYTIPKDSPQPLKPDFSKIRKVSNKKFPLTADITLYDNKVAIASFKQKQPYGVIIESKEISETIRSMFNLAWRGTKKSKKKK
tara:strand:+ start:86 stop:853 length:768 start_codon:yes stop_codon:yes gene_type:complete